MKASGQLHASTALNLGKSRAHWIVSQMDLRAGVGLFRCMTMLSRPQKSGVTFNFASLRSRHPSHFQKFSASIEQANRLILVSRGPGIDVYGTASFLHGRITLHWFRSGVLWGTEAFCVSCTVYVAFKCFAVKLRRTVLQPRSNVRIVLFLSLEQKPLLLTPCGQNDSTALRLD